MPDFENHLLSCAKWEEMPGAYNKINADLPPEIRNRMKEIMFDYMAKFGPQGVFERMNNRTISQIIAEYKPTGVKPIATGEQEGLRYALYETAESNPDK